MTKQRALKIAAACMAATLAGTTTFSYKVPVKAETETTEEVEQTLTDAIVNRSGDGESSKEETVYVIANADGTSREVIVSDWLKNGKAEDVIKDASDLTDIENVKGKETYSGEGDSMEWDAKGADIYYQGKTTKKLPVDVKLTYKLDGKEISPEELAGKSGKVTIRFDYTNHEKKTVKVDGKDTEIYVPFMMASGMLLDNEKFTDVEVTNGKVISEGNHTIVVGVAMPGLSDSLQLPSKMDVDIPEYVEVTANVTDFSLAMTMTAAMTDMLSDVGDDDNKLDDLDDLDELNDSLDDLTDASKKLVDGTSDLADGADDLDEGAGKLGSGVTKLSDGTDTLQKAFEGKDGAIKGAKSLASGAKQVSSGADSLSTGAKTLSTGATSLSTGATSLKSGASSVKSGANQLNAGLAQLSPGAKTLASGADSLNTGVNAMITKLNEMTGTLTTQAATMQQNIAQATAAASQAAAQVEQAKQAVNAAATALAAASNDGEKQAAAATLNTETTKLTKAVAAQAQYTATAETLKTVLASLSSAMGDEAAQQKNAADIKALSEGAKAVKEGAATVSTSVDALYAGSQKLSAGTDTLAQGATDLESGAKQVSTGASTLSTGAKTLSTGAKTLSTGAGSLSKGVGKLYAGVKTVNSGMDTLGVGVKDLMSGTSKLASGAHDLKDGMSEFDRDGIQKLTSKLREVLDDYDIVALKDRVQETVDAGKDYTIFSDAAEDTTSSVKFIYKTDAIEKK